MPPVSDALRRHSEQRREDTFFRLLEAARDLFTEQGYGDTSLDHVVAAAGVTKGSLYHHFRGKADLFEAVFEEQSRELCEQVGAAVARARDPWQGTLAGMHAFLERSQDPAVQRIMLLDAPSVLGWERVREIEAEYGLALIRAALETLMAAGELPRRDVVTLSHLLFGALSEGSLLIARADDPAAARRKVEAEAKRILEGLRS